MPQSAFPEFTLSSEGQALLLAIARETIVSQLEKRAPLYPETTRELRRHCGAFVTLYSRMPTEKTLRGCIGYIGDTFELADAVRRAAAGSAFNDFRFPPLTAKELPGISIEISVLGSFRPAGCPDEVRPGIDGVFIRRGSHSGLLLPQVATEYGWDRRTLLEHACRKAGLEPNAYESRDTEIDVFGAIVFGERSADRRPD